ncbi:alpha/beta fold hydrolase [Halomarina salina]|uniref:Alpha/beta fold hydrolase n=1 Tax=Halomarina salina TaxID=1872699 RepID=A0ABD5RMQ3_9EURY|nr:alpha/beta hydrolase [Halomarina salina]
MPRTDEFVVAGDTELHYSAWGDADAPPVVCVHGLSRVGRDFDPLARRLADDYRVLCPDVPGRGLSEWADDPADYTGTALGQTCVEFCDALDLDELRWVGTSMGGQLGMGLAAGPLADRITHLVMNDVGPAPGEDEDAAEGIERIVDYLSNPPAFDRLTGLEEFYRDNYDTFSEMSDDEWRRFTVSSARRTEDGQFSPAYDPDVVEPLLTEEQDTDPWAVWEAVDVPTLVLKGEHSDILADATFEEMQERRPDVETHVYDCGHAPSLNVPEQNHPIERFLSS